MAGDLIYNGKSLNSFGFFIKEKPNYTVAGRDFELTPIPGGSGSAITDNGSYNNVDINYTINSMPMLIKHKTGQELAYSLIDWLYNFDGEYRVLRDSYNKGYFCYAICKDPEGIVNSGGKLLDTTVTFSRKPYWYSDAGNHLIKYERNDISIALSLFNPEKYFSQPYFKIKTNGSFTLQVNDVYVRFSECTEFVEIDSEIQNIFRGPTDMNYSASAEYLPTFRPGINTIYINSTSGNDITSIEILPRWRRL